MAKRKHPDSQPNDGLYNKRSRLNQADGSDDSPSSQAKIDPTYGQRSAFPGLSDNVEDGLFYGPASDGLEYLRMVRSEAKTVPNLLVAPSSPTSHSQRENLYEDYPQGYYAEGAYTALPVPSSNDAHSKHDQEDDISPQEAYYTSLCTRFEELSSILQNPPFPPDANLIRQPLSWWNSSHWRNRILKTTPQTSKLAQFPQDMVTRGLEVLETVLDSGNLRSGKGKNVGAWAWGLLGRCREVGQMGSEEVGVLRSLGKRAVWLLRRIAAGEVVGDEEDEEGEEPEVDGQNEEQDDEEGEVEDGEQYELADEEKGIPKNSDEATEGVPGLTSQNGEQDGALERVRERVLTSLESTTGVQPEVGSFNQGSNFQTQHEEGRVPLVSPKVEPAINGEANSEGATATDLASVHATLDMLVTIIGEFYGQKDLLDGRLLWEDVDST